MQDWAKAILSIAGCALAMPVLAQAPTAAFDGKDLPNDTFHAFARSDAGHMVGYDAEATADARRRVLEFLAHFMH